MFAGTGAVSAATLTDVDYTALPGDAVQVNFTFDETVSKPNAFKTGSPARVALDFEDVANGLDERSIDVGVGALTGISAAEAGGRTRAVLRLSSLVPYEIETEDRIVQVRLEAPGGSSSGSASASASDDDGGSTSGAKPSDDGEADASEKADGNQITGIDFRRGSDGSGKIIVSLSRESIPVNVERSGGKVIADFGGTTVPDRLRRRLDVTDFATPVKTVTTRQRGSGARIAVTPATEQEFDQISYQTDKSFTIELKPLTKEEKEKQQEEEFQYTGERLSLNFQDIKVRSVLQLIADFTGTNMVVSDSVGGNITLRLQDVPWDQALAIILRSKGLDKRKRGNVLWIATAEEIAQREKQLAEARQQEEDLAPLRTEYIQVNYTKASEVASLVKGSEGRKLISDRGSLSVDSRTNTLIINATQENLTDIRELVNRLDVPVRQVEIQSRIVLATNDFSNELGVEFGAGGEFDGLGQSEDSVGTVGGNTPSRGNFDNSFPGGSGDTSFPLGSSGENLMTSLPASSPTGSLGLAVGEVGTALLQLELTAMENESRGEIISTPRVVTADQQEAFIEEGEEIPFESSDGDSVSTEFEEAFLELTVTPQITPDDRVMMDLEVSNDSRGESTEDGPAIDTQAIGTQVLVDNGETIVLGGVYERNQQQTVDRVPFFGELPVVGRLFKRTSKVDENRELLIFVTPRILDEQVSLDR